MSQPQIASHSQSAPLFLGEVLEGELLDPSADLAPRIVLSGELLDALCQDCGQDHDVEDCCHCPHIHSEFSPCPRDGDCSDYRCCIG